MGGLSDLNPFKGSDGNPLKVLENLVTNPLSRLGTGGIDDLIAKKFGITGGKGLTSTIGGRPAAQRRKKAAMEEAVRTAPAREMARRDAIPLLVDEPAIEEARRRMLLTQGQKSGRQSTMLSSGLGG